MIGLIVAVWLFVLAPIVLRGQKPISRAGDAFDDTRVVYEGGSGDIEQPRRRPRFARRAEVDEAEEHVVEELEETFEEPEVIIEDDPNHGARARRLLAAVTNKLDNSQHEPLEEEFVEPEHPVADAEDFVEEPSDELDIVEADDSEPDDSEAYSYDDGYTSPGDYLHPAADEDEPVDYFDEAEAYADEEQELELTAEDRAFAERRRGRGGYDPVADAANRSSRYQRRQRTFMILIAGLLITTIIGAIVGGMAWIAPSVAAGLTVLYLFVLRQQVRAENELRDRRIRQLRRARLGVRNAHDEELGIPARLRRPGAVVLESDDESPDFEYLEYVNASDYYTDDDYEYRSPRRVS